MIITLLSSLLYTSNNPGFPSCSPLPGNPLYIEYVMGKLIPANGEGIVKQSTTHILEYVKLYKVTQLSL